ncbi:MAG: 4Fe-4S binding protein [Treponema sp.]|jgi:NADH-quinone oxidoreductase subunit F|nr:4Fe-4S binding protein [Treponema sp.]
MQSLKRKEEMTRRKKVLICSAAGDNSPVSKMLCETGSETVIAGIQKKSAESTVDIAYLYIPQGWISTVKPLIDLAEQAGIIVKTGEDSPVCRDTTALVSSLEGRLIRPSYLPDGKLYIEDAEVEDCIGIEEAVNCAEGETGKKYFFVSGAVTNAGFIRAAYGTSIEDIIAIAGGIRDGAKIKAALIGGDSGVYIRADQFENMRLEQWDDIFSGSIELIDESCCIVDILRQKTHAYRQYSCGKCPLCREGSHQFQSMINDMANGKGKTADLALIPDMARAIKLGAFCKFGRNMARHIQSALMVFTEEIEDHVKRKKCPAGICKAYLNFAILPDKCSGCGDCMDVCNEDAIEGKTGYIHMIRDDDCIKCGKCMEICKEQAIITVGSVKPRVPKRLVKVGQFA